MAAAVYTSIKRLFNQSKDKLMSRTVEIEKVTQGRTCGTPVDGPISQLSASSCCSSKEECCNASIEDAIREKAYQLWEQAGCPQSDGVEFWLSAKQELEAIE